MIQRIAVSPLVHFGKPCVAGTRITVESVLELIRDGVSFGDIIQDYFPDLDQQDIYACLEYAIDLVSAEDINLAPAAV